MAKGMVNNPVILILVFFLSSGCGLLAPLFGPVYQTSTSNVDQAKDQGYIRFTDVTEEHLREGHGNSLQYSCLENLHGQRNLVDYSP